MVASERYERDVGKALRSLEGAPEETKIARVGEAFLSFLQHVPVPLAEEIRAWYTDCYTGGDPRFPDPHALALRLSAIIDIFDHAYDPKRSPLDDDEWELVRSTVNEHSPDMRLPLLEYIMQLLMDRGEIG